MKKVHNLFETAPTSYFFSGQLLLNITLLLGFLHWLAVFYLGVDQMHSITILLFPLSFFSWLVGLIFLILIMRVVIFDIMLA